MQVVDSEKKTKRVSSKSLAYSQEGFRHNNTLTNSFGEVIWTGGLQMYSKVKKLCYLIRA